MARQDGVASFVTCHLFWIRNHYFVIMRARARFEVGGVHLKCEIEFLPVGKNSKAGDAIVVRYGEPDDYKLMLVDGGHDETGDEIVAHLRRYYGDNPVIEHVVLTHSDADHACGLRTVLKEVIVRNLWLHVPWLIAEEALHLFKNTRWTKEGLRDEIKAQYDVISEIVELADSAGCDIYHAFAGSDVGPFKILSPTRHVYGHLLPQFDKTPEPNQEAIEAAGLWLAKESQAAKIYEMVKAAAQSWTTETWEHERLKDGGKTSASNESSVILYGSFDMGNVLLTGDAGINGLSWAANAANALSLPLQRFSFVQVPHHGSRRNVGPSILTRLLGDKQPKGSPSTFSAFVSAPADDEKHPRRIVLNAFKRRGAKVIATQGQCKVHWGGFPPREGYVGADELQFYDVVEEYT